jgi:hypothetical protein
MKELKYYLVELWSDWNKRPVYRLVKATSKTDAKKKFVKHFTQPGDTKPSYGGCIFNTSQVIVSDTIEVQI